MLRTPADQFVKQYMLIPKRDVGLDSPEYFLGGKSLKLDFSSHADYDNYVVLVEAWG